MDRNAKTIFQGPLIRILEYGFGAAPLWDTRLEKSLLHKNLTILYFGKGTTNVVVGTKTVTARPGDIVIVNPYEFHAVLTHSGSENDWYAAIYVDPAFILDLREGLFEARYLTVTSGIRADCHFPESHPLADIIRIVISENRRQRFGYPISPDPIMRRFFSLLLQDRFRIPEDLPREKVLKYCKTIEPALEKIRTGYTSCITVELLAELCGVSKFHFCRIFKLVTRSTPLSYLSQYRLQAAQAMLLHSNDSVIQISNACGFEDTCYFCRAFKKQFLFSAQKYRLLHTSAQSLDNLKRRTEEVLLG